MIILGLPNDRRASFHFWSTYRFHAEQHLQVLYIIATVMLLVFMLLRLLPWLGCLLSQVRRHPRAGPSDNAF